MIASVAVMKERRWFWAGCLAAAVLLIHGCQKPPELASLPPPQVVVSKPVQQAVTEYAEFTGRTEAVELVEIRARVEGYLQSIHFQPGGKVREGDLLFQIDPKPYQVKLDEARAEIERRQAELKQADAALKRKEMALKANAVSELEVIQARADRDVAQAAIQGAQAAIESAKLNLIYARITAPIDGRIGRNLADVGNLVGAAERTLLTTIVRDDPVYAYFTVSERDLLAYQQHPSRMSGPTNGSGQVPVFLGLSSQADYPFEGRIDFVNNRLDPSTGTIQVRGVFKNEDGRLLPGLFARIRVPLGVTEHAMLVPDRAVGSDQRGEYLLVVGSQNTVEVRPVQTGPLVADLRVIRGGITAEDHVIIDGVQKALPGFPVVPTPAAPAAGAPDAAQARAQ
ncbi:MAG: efflux RND transporter periplasmic adaptor subunit [Syntrophobacteraceae bacterium]|jgi:RND family efflux transporter MFP subunit|nr:efflux RND transporter periplasmic adaptor subunit [Syntrophobacteraceae bacterium]